MGNPFSNASAPAAAAAQRADVVVGICISHAPCLLLLLPAVAQRADVVVGIHGANTPNAFFLRPGASIIELRMGHPNFGVRMYENWAAWSRAELMWWALYVKVGAVSWVLSGPAVTCKTTQRTKELDIAAEQRVRRSAVA
jgi:hypothetical protein